MSIEERLAEARGNEVENELPESPPDAEEAAAEQKEEPKPEPKEEQKEERYKEHWVPVRHLTEERHRRSALEKELNELKEKFESLAKPEPDYDEDPRAYLDHKLSSIEKKLSSAPTQEQIQQQSEMSQLRNVLEQDDQKARTEIPDYQDALNHVRNTLYYQHVMSGVPQEQINGLIANAEITIARDLLSQGKSPSKFLYDYAVKSMGYKPPEKKETKEDSKIETIKEGQRASIKTSGDAVTSKKGDDVKAFDAAFREMFPNSRR